MTRVHLAGMAFASILFYGDMAHAQRRGADRPDRVAVANGWEFDYEAGLEAARRSRRPLMVVFRCVP